MTKTLTLAAVAVAAMLTTPALAAERTERVAYGDLNLATSEGQAALQHRLDKAAHKVCMFDANGQLASDDRASECYRETRKSAELRFAEAVTHDSRNG